MVGGVIACIAGRQQNLGLIVSNGECDRSRFYGDDRPDDGGIHFLGFVQRFVGFSHGSERGFGGERGEEQGKTQAHGLQPSDQNLPVRVARLIVSRFRSYGVATQVALLGTYAMLAWGLVGIGGLRWRGGWRGTGWVLAGLDLFLPLFWFSEYGI